MSKNNSSSDGGIRSISKNRKAFHNYEILEQVEAGIVLKGTEVKSLRAGKMEFKDAFAQFEKDELYLRSAHIAEYSHGNVFNHEPERPRKLLLHKDELRSLHQKVKEKGLTLVPLELYFKNGRAKIAIGLCRGKSTVDKRQSLREREDKREAERAMFRRR